MYLPNKVFVLTTRGKTNLGFTHNNKSYIVGFPTRECARRIKNVVNTASKIDVQSDDSPVSLGTMSIQKKEVEQPCAIKTISMEEFMKLPLNKNIGVVIGMDLIVDNVDKMKFSSIIIDPVYDIESYRENMVI